jgi:hypothetical protein
MDKVEAKNGGQPLKRNARWEAAANNARSNATSGEVAPGGDIIELVGGRRGNARLQIRHGANELTGPAVKRAGCVGNLGSFVNLEDAVAGKARNGAQRGCEREKEI